MKLELFRDAARALPARFYDRFHREIASGKPEHGRAIDPSAVWAGLQRLDMETATREDIFAAFGGMSAVAESWLWFRCDACEQGPDALVEFDVPCSESGSMRLCRDCCAKLLAAFP